MLDFNKKTAIITGAGRGIGTACAELMLECGANVIMVDREFSEEKTDIDAQNPRVCMIRGDVSESQTAKEAVKAAVEEYGGVDCLVNNAAINIREKALDVDVNHWNRIMDVNLKGYFLFAQEVGKQMTEKRSGSIVNISSELSIVGSATGQTAYSASKGGVNQLTRTLAAEWANYSVRVNAVAPGLTVTPMVAENLKNDEYKRACIDEVPLGRLGKPGDIAQAVVFLSSQWADFITGQILVVDGGYTII